VHCVYEQKKCQIVGAFQGIKLDPMNLFNKNSDTLISTFYSAESVFIVLDEIMTLKSESDYHLSFTGYSFGALLAEESVLFYEYHCKKNDVRATTFDSPGSFCLLTHLNLETRLNLKSLDIVTYLSGFDALNTLNPHVGKIKLFYYDEKYPMSFKNKQLIFNNFLNSNIQELNRSNKKRENFFDLNIY